MSSHSYYDSQDTIDREYGIQVVYINAEKINKQIICSRWFKKHDQRNKVQKLPGKHQTINCGLVYAVRELLKSIRKNMEQLTMSERVPLIIIKTHATYIVDGISTYIYKWRRNNFCNSRQKKIKNHIFWQSINNEIEQLEELNIGIKVFKI